MEMPSVAGGVRGRRRDGGDAEGCAQEGPDGAWVRVGVGLALGALAAAAWRFCLLQRSREPPEAAEQTESTRNCTNTAQQQQQQRSSSKETRQRPRAEEASVLRYRITGKASVRRLEPLLGRLAPGVLRFVSYDDVSTGGVAAGADLVWETTCEKSHKDLHESARILNRLSGFQVLEDKAYLAAIEARMQHCRSLPTFICSGKQAVLKWARVRWPTHRDDLLGKTASVDDYGQLSPANDPQLDYWMLKAASGNGGQDIWLFHANNVEDVLPALQEDESYVIQEYVTRPLLWKGRKFHFRCYASVGGDLSAHVYEMAYILCSSRPFSLTDPHELTHITNLARNKYAPGYPGQVRCHLPSEYPVHFPKIKAMFADLVSAAEDFLLSQRSPLHFEFFGLDVIGDESGNVWLIEVNRLPGLQSSRLNKDAEDAMYDAMMLSLLRMHVLPVYSLPAPADSMFQQVKAPCDRMEYGEKGLGLNGLRFMCHFRRFKRHALTSSR